MNRCSPSTAFRWPYCSLSARFKERPVTGRGRSEVTIEGLAAHWVAELVLHGDASTAEDLLGRTSPHGHIITEEIARHVDEYVRCVRSIGPGISTGQRIKLGEFIEGYCDADVSDAGPTLHIVELKYGWKIVEPWHNWQSMLYARGLLKPHHENVTFHVFQPRPHHKDGPHRKWPCVPREVIINQTDWLIERAELAQHSDAIATPGDYCHDCNGAAQCHALGLNIYSYMEVLESRGWENNPTKEGLSRQLSSLKKMQSLLEARLNGVSAHVESKMHKGEHVPGWMWKDKIGNRKFKVPPVTVEFVTGVKATKTKPLTPADLEAEGVPREVIETLTYRPNIGRELVPATPQEFERIFKDHGDKK